MASYKDSALQGYSHFEGKWGLTFQVIFLYSLCLTQDTKNITSWLDVKLNKPASLYHCIISFINLQQGENETNDTFKMPWDNVFDTMDMDGG